MKYFSDPSVISIYLRCFNDFRIFIMLYYSKLRNKQHPVKMLNSWERAWDSILDFSHQNATISNFLMTYYPVSLPSSKVTMNIKWVNIFQVLKIVSGIAEAIFFFDKIN